MLLDYCSANSYAYNRMMFKLLLMDSFNRFVDSGRVKMVIPLRSLVVFRLGVMLRELSDDGINWLSLL